MFEGVIARDTRSHHLQLVEVSHEVDGRPPPNPTAPAEQERATWTGQNPLHSGNVVQNLVEEENVHLMVLPTWKQIREDTCTCTYVLVRI